MKRTFLISRAGLMLIALCCTAAAQSGNVRPGPDLRAQRPDDSAIEGSTYFNRYFGFRLNIPEGWHVESEAAKKQILDDGRKLVGSVDQQKQAEIDASLDRTVTLLALSRNSALIFAVGAEKLPAPMTDENYVSIFRDTLKYSTVPTTITKAVYIENVGGENFSVVETSSTVQNVLVRQKYYVHAMKGYSLFFILTFLNDETLQAEDNVIKSVRFDKLPRN